MTNYEGHHSVSEQLESSFSKMWILQYINTAVILLIINNRLGSDGIIGGLLKTTGLDGVMFDGDYGDFTTAWYDVIGVTIFTTCFINGITPIANINTICLTWCKRCFDRGCSTDKKKTSKTIQDDYEAVYTGGIIAYDNRLSVLIAMIWTIMTFSAAIPALYFAGILLCFVAYWTDKTLMVQFYRIPPKHGSDLAHKARNIIEWSLIAHLFMGLYMMSNEDIFTNVEEDNTAVEFLKGYAAFVGIGISALTGVDSERFGQVHTVLYSVGVSIFVVLFIIEKVTHTFSKIIEKICCCCLRKDAEEAVFSNDLYCDISSDAQRKEYIEAKRQMKLINESIQKDQYHEFAAMRSYYAERMTLKVNSIKYRLLIAMSLGTSKAGGENPGLQRAGTKQIFQQVSSSDNQTNDYFVERMRGLYSYNVLDSPEYI